MNRLSLAPALLLAGLIAMPAAFAQQTPNNAMQQKQTSGSATKQPTQGDPSGQYNFPTPGGQYSNRPVKQRTEGQDLTGNNHPGQSK